MRTTLFAAMTAVLFAATSAQAAMPGPQSAGQSGAPLVLKVNETKPKLIKPLKPVKAKCKKGEDGTCIKKPHGDKHKAKMSGKTTKLGNPVKKKQKSG